MEFGDSLLEETLESTQQEKGTESDELAPEQQDATDILKHRSLSRHLDNAYDDCYKSVTESVTEKVSDFFNGLLGRQEK